MFTAVRVLPVVLAACLFAGGIGAAARPTAAAADFVGPAGVLKPNLPCGKPISLSPGIVVPPADLVAVTFVGPEGGFGVTASQLACRTKKGESEATRAFPVRLVETADGGHTWKVIGKTAPPGVVAAQPGKAAVASASPQRGWISANGHLDETVDGGHRWTALHLGRALVVTVARAGNVIFAVTADPWLLWRLDLPSGTWTRGAAIPSAGVPAYVTTLFALTALGPEPNEAVVATANYADVPPEIAVTRNGGASWRVSADPCTQPTWVGVAALAEAADGTIAVLCAGGSAASSGTRGFYVSTNSGATWGLRAADTNLSEPNRSGIPLQDFGDVLAAASADHFFLAVADGFAASDDGGRQWSGVPVGGVSGREGFDLDGAGGEGEFTVLNSSELWLLAPGVGLFRTTDGRTWRAA
jgi:hypothetical protein